MKHELSWEEKGYEYEKRYREGRVSTDIWKYIPQNVCEGVTAAFANSDGYWIWLDHEEGGWVAYDGGEDCGIIHDYTISDLKESIRTIRRIEKG